MLAHIDVETFRLDKRSQYTLVVATDGLWDQISPSLAMKYVKLCQNNAKDLAE
jgi:serine/threonine protein phosphatase PrpC